MTISGTTIRESSASDLDALDELYPQAFPTEDLRPLVRELLSGGVEVLSLVATRGERLVGQAIFTFCSVPGESAPMALLGPLAVMPDCQRQGIGKRLVEEGSDRLRRGGVARIFLIGDPAYYGRLGFDAVTDVATPEPIPDEWRTAWQSIDLREAPRGPADTSGGAIPTLIVPDVWRKPEHWAPPPPA